MTHPKGVTMGEIKSTLDIIMEKTKGFTMTDEEKKAFKRKEVEGKVEGLLQKFLDGSMSLDRFKREVGAFGHEQYDMARDYMVEACMGRIDPEGDNAPLLDILQSIGGVETEPIRKILSEFYRELEKRQTDRQKLLRKKLEKQGISGSAVIPNIKADSEWVRRASELREKFHQKIDSFPKK
jgi:hypothetical protein